MQNFDLDAAKAAMLANIQRIPFQVGDLLLYIQQPAQQVQMEAVSAARLDVEKRMHGISELLAGQPYDTDDWQATLEILGDDAADYCRALGIPPQPRDRYEYELAKLQINNVVNYITAAQLHMEDGSPLVDHPELFAFFMASLFTTDMRQRITEQAKSLTSEDPMMASLSPATSTEAPGGQ